ncbi:methyl-accepting chemotaxis protein [Nocardioides ferulae]|uniref:methyl-accepting chemotaxis protein n=1 Tax=Nocardioides ferulae TaxID=2340821 RepID=UPI000EAFDFD4|nr:methyl-accepting chemotaxis protein [Nocardioides ferulae]
MSSTVRSTGLVAALRGASLRTRLLASFLVVSLLTLLVAGFSLERMSAQSERSQSVQTDSGHLNAVRDLQVLWWEYAAHDARTAIESLPPEVLEVESAAAAEAAEGLVARVDDVQALPLDPTAKAAMDEFAAAVEGNFAILDQIKSGELLPAEMGAALAEMDGYAVQAEESIAVAIEGEQAESAEKAAAADAAYEDTRTWTIAVSALAVLVSVGLGVVSARSVAGPIGATRDLLARVADGDLTSRLERSGAKEIEQLRRSLNTTLDSLAGVMTMVREFAGRLAGSSTALSGTADALAAGVQEVAGESDQVSVAAGEVSRNVATLASGSEQMQSAIGEIAHSANEAARVADNAVSVAEETTRTVGRLGDSSREIASVVKVITAIAEQTNLLALNATIEAARAGEAGKGFAVVAGEVKDLAQETARATEDISRRVTTIQEDTAGAVEAIDRIRGVIDEINHFQTTIASAVEEQTATTNEMNRNVVEAAGGSEGIAGSVAGIAGAATRTSGSVQEAQQAAAELARMGTQLEEMVSRFRL